MHAIDPEGLPRGQGPELEDSAVMTPTLHSQALVCFCVFISNKNVQKLKNTKIFKNKKCIQQGYKGRTYVCTVFQSVFVKLCVVTKDSKS